ncbi:ABC transporter ATP-binding protein [Anaerococcus sp. AGMB00486]|uniref:ABC transporter ATP-binding protein n=2 Tax=Anaerococcus TaxID=165779 RepID=A0ABX2N9M8_9FIRM|nr:MULTISPECIES: ABC transporter ATP-binding protein [Anaerococcus]MSS78304.1 ABC transporter ATP-binding protein [Anaerococcus porci]NVF11417.1 ABC transporter ATP-binding protein [Anaerococcus faecalis]
MIKVTKAFKKIGSNQVLSEINLELESAKVYGFQGENGSGKTMLFRAICGFIRLDSGCIEIDDLIIDGNAIYNDIGLLLENPSFIDELSGFNNLAMIASIRKIADKNRIIEVLDKVGLKHAMNKNYKTYSLGMKQRLGLANVILEDPKILIFDEPTIALDQKGVDSLIDIIKEEKEKGKTILVSSHEKNIIEELCDKIFFMENGSLSEIS